MQNVEEAASAFLAKKRVAVTGVSRTPKTHGSNSVYKRLRDRGYEVFAVNPNAAEVEGDRSYKDLTSIPGGVDAVVIGTRPEIAENTMRECAELGIKHVWMHRGPGAGSVSKAATEYGRQQGITVIDGGCPLMFRPTSDFGHRLMRVVYAGKVPKQV
jgi:predicted CoA-binding protein